MKELERYGIYDSETQYDKEHGYYEDFLYQIYGKTESGILFERDLKHPERILLHIGTGIKKPKTHFDREDTFFRKNREGSHFWANYSDYKDFSFNKKESISKDYLIKIVKRFIYMECPHVWNSTLMGGGREGVLGNPNWMYGTFIFEDGKEYTIIKKYDTVKIFEGCKNMYAFSDKEEYCSFKLNEKLYEKAEKLNSLRRFVALNSFGVIDIEKVETFTSIYKELDEITKII
ncbi:hypothetical protein [Clostridium botulinum]|uniref:hypothetical protein n=1 Tax=Clostridium botulinum TaxID=1491 RepID=UPI00174DF4AD|nr:hypothetical protein [Clostridium botulinum]MBD5589332.1 hypothetical protein [Clostridium botulinum]